MHLRRWAGLALVGVLGACNPGTERQGGSVSSLPAPTVTSQDNGPGGSRPLHQGAALTSTGVVVPVLGADGDGWLVGTPCGRTATLTDAQAVQGTVVLDPGHGGSEPGAVGRLGIKESDLNLAVVAFTQKALKAAGVSAIPTRTRDYRIAIPARAAIINAVKPKATVSIHFNAVPSHTQATPGTEIFHQTAGTGSVESRRLAGLVYEEVTAALAKLEIEEWAATPRPGAKHRQNSEGGDFYGILRRTQETPTVLAEVGFLSHEAEERRYAERDVQEYLGQAIARGILRFLNTPDPGSGFVEPPRLADDPRGGGGTANCEDPDLD